MATANTSKRRYSAATGKVVRNALHCEQTGTLKGSTGLMAPSRRRGKAG